MVEIDLIRAETILCPLKVRNQKQLFLKLAEQAAAQLNIKSDIIFSALLDREKLGSTAVGHGVALPHARMAGCAESVAFLAVLDKPLDFDAPDSEPVDLIVMLIAPEDAGAGHLSLMSRITRLMRDEALCQRLRGADTVDAAHAILLEYQQDHS